MKMTIDLAWMLSFVALVHSTTGYTPVSTFMQNLLKNYDKTAAPGEATGVSTGVKVGMYITSIKIDLSAQTASLVMYFRQGWSDARLKHDHPDVNIRSYDFDKIWLPDTFFRGSVVPPSVDYRLLKLNASGSVWYVQRMYVTVDLLGAYYYRSPQIALTTESFGYTMKTLYFEPMEFNPVEIDQNLQINAELVIVERRTVDCSTNYTTGAYPCLEYSLECRPRRQTVGHYCSTIIVFLVAYAAFWFIPASTGGAVCRVLIGLMTVVTSLVVGHWNRGPGRVSALSRDIWISVLVLFVAASFLESVVVIALTGPPKGEGREADGSSKSGASNGKLKKVDFVAKIAFPALYVLFCIIFFASIA